MIGWTDGTSLYHYGILGMKWGERRYQNPDGTYTEEGLKRKRAGIFENRERRPLVREKKRTSNRDRRRMTNEELKARAERLELEKKVKNLEKDVNATDGSWIAESFKKIANKTLVQVGTSVAVAAAIAWIKGSGNSSSDDVLEKDMAEVMQDIGKVLDDYDTFREKIKWIDNKNQW